MILTIAQKMILVAIVAMMLLLLADVTDIINMPNAVTLAVLVPLAIAAHRTLPSLADLERLARRS